MTRRLPLAVAWAAIFLAAGHAQQIQPLEPMRATDAVPNDPDDPAIWVHPRDASQSLVLGTDKIAGVGGLHVFGLDGRRRQTIQPLDRPNNVDVEYDVALPGGRGDVAVVTERMRHRLRVFQIPESGPLVDLAPSGLTVMAGQAGQAGEPMGVALYRRPHDGALFAIVAPKTGRRERYLWQYAIEVKGGALTARLVRRFGGFSRIGAVPGEIGEIEAVVVDDELGFVYYADERYAIRKWHADPSHAQATRELAVFGTQGFDGDREGLALYRRPDGTGYLVASDQVVGGSRLMVFPREGTAGDPHAHPRLQMVPTPADQTDGLEVTARALPGLPDGLLIMMNSSAKNFLLFNWTAVKAHLPAGRPH